MEHSRNSEAQHSRGPVCSSLLCLGIPGHLLLPGAPGHQLPFPSLPSPATTHLPVPGGGLGTGMGRDRGRHPAESGVGHGGDSPCPELVALMHRVDALVKVGLSFTPNSGTECVEYLWW